MSGKILNISSKEVLNALKAGDAKGYVLFPEIRDRRNIELIKKHRLASHLMDELLLYAGSLDASSVPELPFSSFMEFSASGNRLNYEKIYFESKRQLHALVMAELIEEEGRYIEAIQNRLWKWCDTYSWELPAHVSVSPEAAESAGIACVDTTVALFSAETAFYFSEILSLISTRVDPLLVSRLRTEIEKRVVGPFLKNKYEWEQASNNWASVCAGAMGCTAIYTISGYDQLCSVLLRVIDALECYLSGFDSNGMTTEGLTYWSYGFSFFVYFSELLKERTCGVIDLLHRHEKLRRIAELPMYLHFPDGTMVNFSDAPGLRWEGTYELQCRLSRTFGITGYNPPEDLSIFRDHTSKWAITSRSLFWVLDGTFGNNHDESSLAAPARKFIDEISKTGMFFFPECQWLIDRRTLPSIRAFAAKGGNNGEPHNHNDLGHFILLYGGDILLADLGAPEYTRKYFRTERYEVLHASSKGHSVPVINGKEQAPGMQHAAKVIECVEIEGIVHFGLDLTAAYENEELQRFHRKFSWDHNKGILSIIDEFNFTRPGNTVLETFITLSGPVKASAGNLLIKGRQYSALLEYAKEAQAEMIHEEFTDHFGCPSEAWRTLIRYDTGAADLKISSTISIKAVFKE